LHFHTPTLRPDPTLQNFFPAKSDPMANLISNSKHRMSMKVFQDPRKPSRGAPKAMHRHNKPLKSNIKKIANGTRTGDVISDDSDGDDEGDSTANEDDEDDDDDADVFALSGGPRMKRNANGRLAGRMSDDVNMFDADQAVPGAERESTNDSDEEDYNAVDEISDSDDSNADADEKTVLRKAERDLIAEFQSTEKPRAAKVMANEMDDMCLEEESGLSRRTSMQSEISTDADLDFGLDFTQDPFGGLNSNDSLYQELIEDAEGQFDGDLASWRIPDVHPDSLMMHGGSRDSSVFSTHTAKKVRFDENTSTRSRTSSLSSEDIDPRDAYPDLLDSADTPIGRSSLLLVNMDADGQVDQMDTESLYDFDFEDEYEKAAFEIDQSDSEVSSSDDCMNDDSCWIAVLMLTHLSRRRRHHRRRDRRRTSCTSPRYPKGQRTTQWQRLAHSRTTTTETTNHQQQILAQTRLWPLLILLRQSRQTPQIRHLRPRPLRRLRLRECQGLRRQTRLSHQPARKRTCLLGTCPPRNGFSRR
jgi:hypothetical protein